LASDSVGRHRRSDRNCEGRSTVADTVLQRQQILDATEDVLRRYGPAKATVADVARELQVSPGAIYRHFPSKAALREAVTHDWLDRICAELPGIAAADEPPAQRLAHWLTALYTAKKSTAVDDPRLFDTYSRLIARSSTVEDDHLEMLLSDLRRMIRAGADEGVFHVDDVDSAALAVLAATSRFHNPQFAQQWSGGQSDRAFAAVLRLVLAGLTADPPRQVHE
jgi:AcrR family transcriptional regulator